MKGSEDERGRCDGGLFLWNFCSRSGRVWEEKAKIASFEERGVKISNFIQLLQVICKFLSICG